MSNTPAGLWVVGSRAGRRHLVNWQDAFTAYANLDDRVDPEREAHLSHFAFGDEFVQHFNDSRSERGYTGPCYADWLFFDIDNAELTVAHDHAKRLVAHLTHTDHGYGFDEEDLLVFYSGSRGFHVGLPTLGWAPAASADFPATCRRLCERVADHLGITIDPGIYQHVHLLRTPNTKHPTTGRYKRWLSVDELLNLPTETIVKLADTPIEFDIPTPRDRPLPAIKRDVGKAEREAWKRARAYRTAALGRGDVPRLNQHTEHLVRFSEFDDDDGTRSVDPRYMSVYRAAGHLAEIARDHGIDGLIRALVVPPALEHGMPKDQAVKAADAGIQRALTSKEGD